MHRSRYHLSASGDPGTWSLAGQRSEEAPEGIEPTDHARQVLDLLVATEPKTATTRPPGTDIAAQAGSGAGGRLPSATPGERPTAPGRSVRV
ncbi:hypothetical protein ADK55_10745 [Streptomyces sp. WM4235]|nr:hypothetical protein ADK55_10745 [Streptomyces sp. WM4235]